jgi:hypothetical protein
VAVSASEAGVSATSGVVVSTLSDMRYFPVSGFPQPLRFRAV